MRHVLFYVVFFFSVLISQPDPDEEDFRFVPDTMLLDLREQVEEADRNIDDIRKFH